MKNFHQNLLIVLALCLCGLCAWQWYEQARAHGQIEQLSQLVYEKSAAIQGYTNSITTLNHQIDQMDASLTGLREVVKSNAELIVAQKQEIGKLQFTGELLTNQITEYKAGIDTIESKLKKAYDDMRKQNDVVKELTAQRDDFVQKLNDSIKDRNDIVAKYNELAAQVKKMQDEGK